jgi:hypothetical protein
MTRHHPPKASPQSIDILMASGAVKTLTAIEVGDEIMGADSLPRTVIDIRTSVEDTFEIRPIKGASFVLGASQSLPLVRSTSLELYDLKSIPVWEYLKQSPHFKGVHLLYRMPVNFSDGPKLPLDPYFLGILLGDGCFRNTSPSITTPDPEIVDYCFVMADQMGLSVRIDQIPGNQANGYYFSSISGKTNPLTDALRNLGLYNKSSPEKFIPDIYKRASQKVRQEILAGLLDTDGHMLHKTFEYTTSSKQLAQDIAFVAQSLGLMALPKERTVEGQIYYRFCIYGDFKDIPLRVGRKIPGPRVQKRHVLRTGFTVHTLQPQQFLKLVLQGPNSLYLKSDFMVMQGEQP